MITYIKRIIPPKGETRLFLNTAVLPLDALVTNKPFFYIVNNGKLLELNKAGLLSSNAHISNPQVVNVGDVMYDIILYAVTIAEERSTIIEKLKLDAKSRGFLLFMENMDQIDANQREMIIDQIMSLGDSAVSLDDLKWVVMMVW